MIVSLEAQLSSSLRRSFLELEEDITHDTLKGVPADGTVSELTSNTLHYLKRLLEYRTVVEGVLPKPTGPQKQPTPFCDLITRIIKSLLFNLEDKADKARKKDKVLANIFMLNNIYYISSALNASNISPYLEPKYMRYLQDLLMAESNAYKESWQKAIEHLGNEGFEDFSNKSLTSKMKKKLKAKYAGFNAAIEELFEAQKRFTIPDEQLCEQLRSDIKAVVMSPYKNFFEMHPASTFTSNSGKYVKYTPATLEDVVNHFYSSQAVRKNSRMGLRKK